MECALYEPDQGFFGRGQGAGRAGDDFVTSPEVGSLFGACVARAIDRNWDAARPSGPVSRRRGRCRPRPARTRHPARRARVPRRAALCARRAVAGAARAASARSCRSSRPTRRSGPFVAPRRRRGARCRAGGRSGVRIARGPPGDAGRQRSSSPTSCSTTFRSVSREWDGDRWDEVRVAVDGSRFVEMLVPAIRCDASALTARRRRSRPASAHASADSARCRGVARRVRTGDAHAGSCVLLDYFVDVDELLRLAATTGYGPTAGTAGAPARSTSPAARTSRATSCAATSSTRPRAAGFSIVADTTQADWLRDLGIDELVADGRRAWDEGAARGDLAALAGRSRVAARRRAHRRRRARRAPRRDAGEAAPDRAVRTPVASAATGAGYRREGEPGMAEALEALLQEGRTFPPSEQFRKDALITDASAYAGGASAIWQGHWATPGARARLDRGVGHHPRVGPPVREVVRRREAQRRVQLPRPACRSRSRRPGRVPLGRRARRHARRSPTASCSTSRAASRTC